MGNAQAPLTGRSAPLAPPRSGYGSWSYINVFRNSHLGMKQEAASCSLTVGIYMGCVKSLDLIHNFNAQPRSDLIMAKPSLYTFLFKKDIDALCQAYKTVHAGETIPVDKALLRKEVMFKESAFLYLKPDSLIHVPCHNIQYIRQLLFFKSRISFARFAIFPRIRRHSV